MRIKTDVHIIVKNNQGEVKHKRIQSKKVLKAKVFNTECIIFMYERSKADKRCTHVGTICIVCPMQRDPNRPKKEGSNACMR